MTIVHLIFYFFSSLTLVSALFLLFTKNVVHAVLSLLSVFIGVSAIYIVAGADFLAITQLVIYVGGILILMLFGVMLTNRESNTRYLISQNRYFIFGLIAGMSLSGILIYLLIKNQSLFIHADTKGKTIIHGESTIHTLGINLISQYVLPFEVGGVLLLVALIGAAFIAGRKKEL
ncbi:MAG TPA: NADH-quinone oxidoreductase subunit J [Cytophagaceae bacterium]|jgi:NADH:ubiquinone oxidoreductase subunit 6 (subunit J)|nr:NADH-quinone oxidoreductase subunit J [Cytophagaceae bacterium]